MVLSTSSGSSTPDVYDGTHEGLPFPNPQPHQPHLRRSYSESGGKSGTTLPETSIYSNQPYVRGAEDDVFQPYTAQPFSSYNTPSHGTEPYMLRSAFINTQHCSILTGASDYAVPLDSNLQASPMLVPAHQMGYCSQSQGYGTHLDNHQYACNMASNYPSAGSTSYDVGYGAAASQLARSQTHTDANTASCQPPTEYDKNETPLVATDNEADEAAEPAIPTVVDSDSEASPTKLWRIKPLK